MSKKTKSKEGSVSEVLNWTLQGPLTVQHIERNFDEVHHLLASPLPVKVDCEGLTQIDTSGYQLLISVIKTCEQREQKLVFINIDGAIEQSLRLLGDQKVLGMIAAE